MTTPGVLLFVAPAARIQPLGRELLRRVGDAGYALSPEPDQSTEAFKVGVGDHILALTSWRALLEFIDADVQAAGDTGAAADLRQLGDLCDQMDTEAFLPLTSEEMTANLGRRIMQFGQIASDLTDILVQRGHGDVKGLKATSRMDAPRSGSASTTPTTSSRRRRFGPPIGRSSKTRTNVIWRSMSPSASSVRR